MPNEQLVAHIKSELARGVEKTVVIQSLIGAGWRVEDINAAMASIGPTGMPSAPHAPMGPQPGFSTGTISASHSLKSTVQDIAAGLFIACVTILTLISILGVWDVFTGDVIVKSFETLGLLAIVSIVVIGAGKWVGDPTAAPELSTPNPAFRAMRNITLVTLIVSSTFLALLGVLAIWDIIADSKVVSKSLSTLAIIAFSSLIIVMVCREREQIPPKKKIAKVSP